MNNVTHGGTAFLLAFPGTLLQPLGPLRLHEFLVLGDLGKVLGAALRCQALQELLLVSGHALEAGSGCQVQLAGLCKRSNIAIKSAKDGESKFSGGLLLSLVS